MGFAGDCGAPRREVPRETAVAGQEKARTLARSVSAEMHSSFANLRSRMPLNCRASRPDAGRGPGVQEDIDRVCEIWRECRKRHMASGEFLFGEFTAADAMFAPVASRFQTYDVKLDRPGLNWVDRIGNRKSGRLDAFGSSACQERRPASRVHHGQEETISITAGAA